MKKLLPILLSLLAILAMSCDRKNVELVTLEEGELAFFDMKSQTLTPFEAETDSVISMVFYSRDQLFYTVCADQNLKLKMVDLSQKKPEPILCADWGMTLEENRNFMTGGVSDLYVNQNRAGVMIPRVTDPEYYSYTDAKEYNLNDKTVEIISIDDFYEDSALDEPLNYANFYNEDGTFYFVDKKGRHSLNDQIDLSDFFEGEELDEVDYYPVSKNPHGDKVVFTALLPWGEGWGCYCLASLDGSAQCELPGSDVWDQEPQWLADGSLVYVSGEAIHIMKSDTEELVLDAGTQFAVRPYGEQKPVMDEKLSLVESDMVIFDGGEMTFYNSSTHTLVPYPFESDSVVNGVFEPSGTFFYTVSINGDLYLKSLYTEGVYPKPKMRTGWDLRLDDCVSQTYGRVSPLCCVPSLSLIGIFHNFSWDYYSFADTRFYNYGTWEKQDGWGDEEETDSYDEEFLQREEDIMSFSTRNGQYYYTVNGSETCLTYQMRLEKYVSDPEYATEPEFDLIGIDPTRRAALFMSILEYGDLGHGPLCLATLDGRMQLVLEGTDAADYNAGWLQNGVLVYTDEEGIKMVSPEGEVTLFSTAHDFVVK